MLVKDMFLRNKKFFLALFSIIFFFISYKVHPDTDNKSKVINHLYSLKSFSASFLQNDGESLSEGKVYIGKERVRAEYLYPTKILIILDEDKAMYYNYELEEDEFFNPKNTKAWFFYDIFRNPIFFLDAKIKLENKEIILEKNGIDYEKKNYLIRVFFENEPLVLRKLEVRFDEDILELSIYDHNYNENFDKDFFKLINPKFFN